ncbi:hypothetical protein AVEN_229833-1 [Araneus ventricosus]|uniref:Uncharacterized protein n=1 Tax=Araneus ventricosus TaxID=182803 RepID=A0A4Y2DAC4_ARAVE|nr:hypothetical protein AVEN_1252-1 [Araneus ventricosus]GBM13660.1 hypothetical protein AVEN_229833-1 [Araneus ventricosus]
MRFLHYSRISPSAPAAYSLDLGEELARPLATLAHLFPPFSPFHSFYGILLWEDVRHAVVARQTAATPSAGHRHRHHDGQGMSGVGPQSPGGPVRVSRDQVFAGQRAGSAGQRTGRPQDLYRSAVLCVQATQGDAGQGDSRGCVRPDAWMCVVEDREWLEKE